jgi:pimeloyl-ACP methyl ester carboxylesterase
VLSVPLPGLVLVHGGEHAGDCWDLVAAEIRRQEPALRVLAVDLPGRGRTPGDLGSATIGAWVDSVVADVEREGFDEIVIVGHSMAGVTVPGVVAKLGSARVREMILAAAFVPPQGKSIADKLGGPLAVFARHAAKGSRVFKIPRPVTRFAFCNGMTPEQRRLTMSKLRAESPRIPGEPVNRSDLPDAVPRTWILTTRDRALSQKSQRASIAALGGVEVVIPMDACHELMFSHPEQLAKILVERCRFRQRGPS